MGNATNHDTTSVSERPDSTFHQVRRLIPGDQALVTIEPDMKVADALKLMEDRRYSQLPVVVESAVLGIFSYRSFSQKALINDKKKGDKWLGDLPVEDFLEDYEFVPASQDWNRVLHFLNQDDAFLVGHGDGLEGLVTTADVLSYFRKIADPFIMLAEIELSLRKIIEACIDEDSWQAALSDSLSTAYHGREVPLSLDDMTFDNYVQIISNTNNWRYFEQVFGPDAAMRKQANRKLQQLRDWRNITFHLRRPLEAWEVELLGDYRQWLQRRVRAYDARLKVVDKKAAAAPGVYGKRATLMSESAATAVEFFNWVLTEIDRRPVDYATKWNLISLSVRRVWGERPVTIAFCTRPEQLQVYLEFMQDQPEALAALRRTLLSRSPYLKEKGKHTLDATVTAESVAGLKDVFLTLLDELDRLAGSK